MKPQVKKILNRIDFKKVALGAINVENLRKRISTEKNDFSMYVEEIERLLNDAADVVMEMQRQEDILREIEMDAVDALDKIDDLKQNAKEMGLNASSFDKTYQLISEIDDSAANLRQQIERQANDYNSILR